MPLSSPSASNSPPDCHYELFESHLANKKTTHSGGFLIGLNQHYRCGQFMLYIRNNNQGFCSQVSTTLPRISF